jgi:putative ABC transport system permease protein
MMETASKLPDVDDSTSLHQGRTSMTTLLRDARFACRIFSKSPAFTSLAIVVLALGISSTTAIFSVVYGTFFAPLPYRDPEALVMVWSYDRDNRIQVSAKDFVAWKRETTGFSDLNAWGGRTVNLATDDRPENVPAGVATPGFLGMMGYGHPLAAGRSFTEDEGIVGRDRVVLLTYRLWQDRFGGDPAIVGRPIRLDNEPYTVVGVLGEGPADRQQSKIWLPLAFTPEQLESDNRPLLVMGRLRPGVTIQQADDNLAAVAAAFYQRTIGRPGALTTSVEPFRNNFIRPSTKQGLWLLLAAVGFLLLIACANVANLLLARGSARQRELALRAALGATNGAIARQLLIESLVLAFAGGIAGALLASVLLDAIVALMPQYTLPSETEITLSVPVLLFALGVCALAGALSGLAPAWQAARANLTDAIKEGGRAIGGGRHLLRRVLVVLEFALALTLLAGGGLAAHAFIRTMNVDLGFRTDHLLTLNLPVPRGRFTTPEAVETFYRQLLDRTATLPGVRSASISTGMPMRGTGFGGPLEIVGRIHDPANPPRAGVAMVTPRYFETFGIRILRGRAFTEQDRAGSPRVAIVNEAFVKRYLAGADPLTTRVRMRSFVYNEADAASEPVEWEIVGVYGDVRNAGPTETSFAEIDVPFWQTPWPRTTMAVQTTGNAPAVLQDLAKVIHAFEPDLPLANVRTIEELITEVTAADRFYTVLFGAFAAVALTLAAVGIYGVMSFVVAQRTQEIGVRMALGAPRARVVREVLREGMSTALIGTLAGGVGAWFVGLAMKGMIYNVEVFNPIAFAIVAGALLGSALMACLVPARRAARVDPIVALRQE